MVLGFIRSLKILMMISICHEIVVELINIKKAVRYERPFLVNSETVNKYYLINNIS